MGKQFCRERYPGTALVCGLDRGHDGPHEARLEKGVHGGELTLFLGRWTCNDDLQVEEGEHGENAKDIRERMGW